LKLPTLVAAVSPKQTGMELMDELARRRGQIPAALDQLTPEASGRGPERQWTKRIADLSHQRRQMCFKPPPIC